MLYVVPTCMYRATPFHFLVFLDFLINHVFSRIILHIVRKCTSNENLITYMYVMYVYIPYIHRKSTRKSTDAPPPAPTHTQSRCPHSTTPHYYNSFTNNLPQKKTKPALSAISLASSSRSNARNILPSNPTPSRISETKLNCV